MDLELKAALDALGAEHKTAFSGLKAQLEALKSSQGQIQTQVDAIDLKMRERHLPYEPTASDAGLKEFREKLAEHKEAFDRFKTITFEIPTLLPEGKSTILSTGLTSTEPATGIQGAGRFPYRLRTLFRSVPTQLPTINVLRSNVETLNASPQTQGDPKSESTFTFSLVSVPIQTLATFVNFSRQAMDDIDGFMEFINSTLIWSLERKAESEIISGDGTGVHLPGLATGATAFDVSILTAVAGWNACDILGAAAVQLQEAGYVPDFAVVSPRNWFRMVSRRDTIGQYVLNSPRTQMGRAVYDLQVIPSDRVTGNTFLVGDSSKAVIRQRAVTTVSLSYEHGTNFTSNLVTALAEERFGIQTSRPDAFVQGTLTSSPA